MEDLESLESKNASIEQHVKEIARERLSLEQEVLDRVEEVLADEKTKMKKMMTVIFSGCAICVVSMVLLVKKW